MQSSNYNYTGYTGQSSGDQQQQQGYYSQQPQQPQGYGNGYYSNANSPAYPSPGYPAAPGYPPAMSSQPSPMNASLPPAGPPPTQSSYSAYPEHYKTAGAGYSFQGAVAGLSGWNDPPSTTSDSDLQTLKSVDNPVGLVVSSFTNAVESIKASPNLASQKRMIDDTEKRIDNLLDRLANHNLPDGVLACLVTLSNAMNSRDMNTANQVVMKMMTSNWPDETRWMVGAKRLIELLGRI